MLELKQECLNCDANFQEKFLLNGTEYTVAVREKLMAPCYCFGRRIYQSSESVTSLESFVEETVFDNSGQFCEEHGFGQRHSWHTTTATDVASWPRDEAEHGGGKESTALVRAGTFYSTPGNSFCNVRGSNMKGESSAKTETTGSEKASAAGTKLPTADLPHEASSKVYVLPKKGEVYEVRPRPSCAFSAKDKKEGLSSQHKMGSPVVACLNK
ncbi:hypothetical protein ACSQ67_018477 [Phaseolus vulgaris]